jgi:hypothetical protein
MALLFTAAVEKAAAILSSYREEHGDDEFPTIKGKLWPIVEHEAGKNGIDEIIVQRFDEPMHPVVGQVRRVQEQGVAYGTLKVRGKIYLCPSLDLDWQRWVQMKEASHLLLDQPDDFMVSDTDIDHVLRCFAQFDAEDVSTKFVSEMRATVCANEMLFPFAARVRLKQQYDNADLSPAQIARGIGIPPYIVRHVMGERYWAIAEALNAEMLETVSSRKVHAVK